MLRRPSAGAGATDERPFLPRAFSVLRAPAEHRRAAVPDRGRRSRDRAACAELEPGDELRWSGRWGSASPAPRDGRRPLLVGGGVGIAPLAIWQDQLGARDAGALLGFRDAAHAAGRRAAATTSAWPPTTAASATTGWSPSCSTTSSTATRTPRSTPAGRRRCSRPCGSCAPSRDIPAQLALESGHGLRLRRLLRLRRPDQERLRPAVRRRPGASTPRALDTVVYAGGLGIEPSRSVSVASAGSSWPTRSSTPRARSTRSRRAGRSATSCSSGSRSRRSCPRR